MKSRKQRLFMASFGQNLHDKARTVLAACDPVRDSEASGAKLVAKLLFIAIYNSLKRNIAERQLCLDLASNPNSKLPTDSISRQVERLMDIV